MTRTPEEKAELVAKLKDGYEKGLSLKQLSKMHDVAASYIGRMLRQAGVTMRPPADQTTVRREGWGDLNRQQTRAYRERLASKKIGK